MLNKDLLISITFDPWYIFGLYLECDLITSVNLILNSNQFSLVRFYVQSA
jgi:hypothetical protein